MDKDLVISEMFYSIQGEGPSSGIPSVFVRMTSCNLTCNGWSYVGKDGQRHGCDSTEVWKVGKPYTLDQVYEVFVQNKWDTALQNGAHLVLTGGEPMLRQRELSELIEFLEEKLDVMLYVEVETNGTITPNQTLFAQVAQWNCSPKLLSNGDPEEKTYKPETLSTILGCGENVIFKFVVMSEVDVQEVYRKYIDALRIPKSQITFMPEGAKHDVLKVRSQWLVEVCKREHIRYSPRLHIHIWEQATGV